MEEILVKSVFTLIGVPYILVIVFAVCWFTYAMVIIFKEWYQGG